MKSILSIPEIYYWTGVYLGSLCGHILCLYNPNFKRTIPFLKGLIPKKSESFYARVDFAILPMIGSVLGYFLITPTGYSSAVFAGLSWSGTLIALLNQKNAGDKSVVPVDSHQIDGNSGASKNLSV